MNNHRQRLQAALDHKPTDRACIDFGATAVTGMHVSCVAALRDYYGLESKPVKVVDPYQMLGEVDEELLDIMGVDVVGVWPLNTMFGFPMCDWRECRLPWGQVVLVPGGFKTTTDTDGSWLIYPEGDTTAPPSGRMPAKGFFFDSIMRQPPINEDALDPRDNMEEFQPMSKSELAYFTTEIRRAARSGRGVAATFGGTAFGDIALVPAPFLKHPKGIRDITEWYMSTAARQDYIHAVFEHQCTVALANLKKIHQAVGDLVDVVYVCGTDFGTQKSLFCSLNTYDNLYAPYYKRINDWIHQHTAWKTFKHCCGAIEPLMSHLIDSGFDIINPVQCSAAGMDSRRLKEKYGEQLVFWGGGIDTQRTLPFGKPEEVTRQVRQRIDIFNRNGGFVFTSIHNIQMNTPVENIVAMIETANEGVKIGT
ncbi:MAG: hypothetical protein JW709_10520 [Sedimentisphaerales bacterium]|nr:hypothetical protein [Sedimentisphaerales bacterium]